MRQAACQVCQHQKPAARAKTAVAQRRSLGWKGWAVGLRLGLGSGLGLGLGLGLDERALGRKSQPVAAASNRA